MKIAIYPGSFNPVHNGHVSIANALLLHGFDEVWMLVSPLNPHKTEKELWPYETRLQMAKLAFANTPKIKVSDLENQLPKPSYTIHTLEHLRNAFPDHHFKLVIGEDNLKKFNQWKSYSRIALEFGLVVYPRLGTEPDKSENYPNTQILNASLLDISASVIREKLLRRESIHGLVPEAVEHYILLHGNF